MTAGTILRGSAGAECYFTLPLPREIKAALDRGDVEYADEAETPQAAPEAASGEQRPALDAPKRDWVAYAVAVGALKRTHAQGLEREELIALLHPDLPAAAEAFGKA